MRALVLLLSGVCILAAGCTPAIAPVYRDFAPHPAAGSAGSAEALQARLRDALQASGWQDAPAPDGRVLVTAPRRVAAGVFGTTEATLFVTPLSDGFVRVQAVAVRRGLFGGRTRLPYLSPGLQRSVLGGVTEALAARGFVAVGTPEQRDERARTGRETSLYGAGGFTL
ncbi:MAG: hypothetical protein ACK41D_12130 [Rubricoccaceae bacterium]